MFNHLERRYRSKEFIGEREMHYVGTNKCNILILLFSASVIQGRKIRINRVNLPAAEGEGFVTCSDETAGIQNPAPRAKGKRQRVGGELTGKGEKSGKIPLIKPILFNPSVPGQIEG